MNQTVILLVIGAAALVAILVPLLRGGKAGGPAPTRAARPRAAEAPEVPDALAELELDHDMGRLTDEDYEALREKALADAEAWSARPVGEEPVAATPAPVPRDRKPAPRPAKAARRDLDALAEEMIRRQRARPRAACPTCGDRPEPGATFCSNCGQELAACPACGHRLGIPDAKFCPECGVALGA